MNEKKTNRMVRLRCCAAVVHLTGRVLGVLSPLAAAQNTITRSSSFEYDADGLLILEVIEPDRPQDCL